MIKCIKNNLPLILAPQVTEIINPNSEISDLVKTFDTVLDMLKLETNLNDEHSDDSEDIPKNMKPHKKKRTTDADFTPYPRTYGSVWSPKGYMITFGANKIFKGS